MKKQSSFKMKGFSGFGVSPAKQVKLNERKEREPKKPKRTNFNVSNPPVKPNRDGKGGTLRPVSGFEFDFPKTKRVIDNVINIYSPKQVMKRSKKLVKNVSKKAKQGIDYFRAR